MNTFLKKKLLSAIKNGSSLNELVKRQIPYTEIVDQLIVFCNEGLIGRGDKGFFITAAGELFLTEKDAFEKIKTLDEYRLEKKLSLDDIYIPNYIKELREDEELA
ncbi:hypothetical protein IKQ19_12840 [Candidatus Saccharibacteria bacterium]|nr:hypothetical protein [Candidatus Saccharibacteria bacterium]